ncbi:predicted protein [Naegleria gruberi]|uniref:Predicted protein n=1 Tax=Naegleria gruberi TaxID=5762 RepID=D2V8C7_NAEGR|nr:uncharacterized protein NAEGRDRAFT_65110 [Naegleria gruberi]EFC47020.1 predicted protein [Naegleria gruberi]|eukprot:XP_002679764.1 predicted protein [Naegleria gruberi strain NEG-M]
MDMLRLIEYDPHNFHLLMEDCEARDELLDNEEFMMKVVSCDGRLFEYVSVRLKEYFPLMLEAVKQNGMMIGEMEEEFYTKELVLQAVKEDGQAFPGFGQYDMEIARTAVENNGLALENISASLMTDEIIHLACEENPMARDGGGIDWDSKDDSIAEKILKTVMKEHPESCEYLDNFHLSEEKYFQLTKTALKYSQDLTILDFSRGFTNEEYEELAKYDGDILSMVDAYFHTRRMFYYDRDVILKAVSQNGLALEHASYQDEEIIKAALNQTKFGGNLRYASTLRSDKEVVLAAVNSCGLSLKYADSKLLDDPEIVKAAILNNPFSIRYASKKLRLDLSFARLAKELREADLSRFDTWQDITCMYKKRSRATFDDSESDTDDEDEEEETESDKDELSQPPKQFKVE